MGDFVPMIPDGHVRPRLCKGLGDPKPDTGSGASDNGRLPGIVEEREHSGFPGRKGVVVNELAVNDRIWEGAWVSEGLLEVFRKGSHGGLRESKGRLGE